MRQNEFRVLAYRRDQAFKAAARAYDQYTRSCELWGVMHPITTRYHALWWRRWEIWSGCVERVVKGKKSGHVI